MNEGEVPSSDQPPATLQRPRASAEDFAAVDVEVGLPDPAPLRLDLLADAFAKAAEQAEQRQDEPGQRVFSLLAQICRMHLRVGDKTTSFGPQWSFDGDRRTLSGDDLAGEQSRVLALWAPKTRNPALRARVADIAWSNSKREAAAGKAAAEGYLEVACALLREPDLRRFKSGVRVSTDILEPLQRALQISKAISKRGTAAPPELKLAVLEAISLAEISIEAVPFERLMRLALIHELDDSGRIARRAQAFADGAADTPSLLVIKNVYELAAEAYRRAGGEVEAVQCDVAGVEALIRLGRGMGGGAEVRWVQTAIRLLRRIPGTETRRSELRAELPRLQERALDDLKPIGVDIDLTEMRSGVAEFFEGLSFSDMLLQFALIVRSPEQATLEAEVREQSSGFVADLLFPTEHLDQDGKSVARRPSAGDGDDGAWLAGKVAEGERFRRQIAVDGKIEPARRLIGSVVSIQERHLSPIAQLSPFVSPGHEHIFELGFARLFQGDFISCAHLLLPQLEPSLRNVLRQHGHTPTKMGDDGLEEDRGLNPMLKDMRPELEAIFGEAVIYEVSNLFDVRIGPHLRHETAHGKLSTGLCLSADARYACWFIYSLTVLPLISVWTTHVAPQLGAEVI